MISPQGVSLEEEIRLLRKWMERLVDEEQSFTTEVVIAISTLLDLKINEFMKKQER
ncbi:aspartyl-phosphate phosphatase Spo0E family protein [Paenibacillus turicensis]|nr:aspartyl-phosphate phosphatase Spo0E family protein [Paenibacillus turicensis]